MHASQFSSRHNRTLTRLRASALYVIYQATADDSWADIVQALSVEETSEDLVHALIVEGHHVTRLSHVASCTVWQDVEIQDGMIFSDQR
eukprot:COSAG01_NODE_7259_length_3279_cov_1.994025_2_plen_89_part_00